MTSKSEKKIRITPEQYLDVINDVKNATSMQTLLDSAIAITGINMITYHHIVGPGTYDHKTMEYHVCHNFPQELETHLNSREFTQNNPSITVTFASTAPIWLSDMLNHELIKGHPIEPLFKQLLKASTDGIFYALYGPEERKGYVFVSFAKPKDQFDPIFEWQMGAMLQMLHLRYCVMLRELQKKVKLTKRETEVLKLIALGKTNPEIGIILNISKNTVGTYIKGIFLKLETSDRVTTSMRARALNLLD